MDSFSNIDQHIQEAIKNRYAKTEESLKLGHEILEISLTANNKKGIAYGNLVIGICKSILSSEDDIYLYLLQAYDYFVQNKNEFGFVIALNFMAIYYDGLGNYEKALEYVMQGLSSSFEADFPEYEADLLSTGGMLFSRIGNTDKALVYHKKALTIREAIDNYPAQASSLNLIARTNVLAKNYESAQKYYQKSIDLRTSHNDKGGLLWCFIGMASMLVQTCEMENANNYYFKAQSLNDIIKDSRANFLIKKGIAKTYLISKEFNKAKDYVLVLLDLANTTKSKPLLYQAYQILSEYYDAIGDYETALQYYKDYTSTKDEVISEQTLNRLHQQQASFEIEQSKKEAEIHRLKHVELKNAFDEITDSINYAERIQKSLFPNTSELNELFEDHFILFKPKDIVSGDFYWFKQLGNKLVITASDCTGHGVPGAFMSMLGISFLNDIVSDEKYDVTNNILDRLRVEIKNALKQKGEVGESKDGMDMALCVINLDTLQLQYSGAYNPLYIIRNGELIQFKADRQPIAIYAVEKPFTLHTFQLEKNDCLYMFSDGYADQFGGPEDRKFMGKNLRQLFLDIHEKPMNEQYKIMDKTFEDWKGTNDQMDDVIVIGLKI